MYISYFLRAGRGSVYKGTGVVQSNKH